MARTIGRIILAGGLVAALGLGGAEAAPALVGLLGITPGVVGGFIGKDNSNRVTDHYGTVAGGQYNRAGNLARSTGDATHATVAGGRGNAATDSFGTVG